MMHVCLKGPRNEQSRYLRQAIRRNDFLFTAETRLVRFPFVYFLEQNGRRLFN